MQGSTLVDHPLRAGMSKNSHVKVSVDLGGTSIARRSEQKSTHDALTCVTQRARLNKKSTEAVS